MKKFLILLMSLIITGGTSFAAPSSFVGCAAPYDLSSGIGRTLANATGSNLIAQQVAQSLIKRQLKKESGEKFKVKVSDLKSGSSVKVNVRCDRCGKEYFIKYSRYNERTNMGKHEYICINCMREYSIYKHIYLWYNLPQ